LALLDQKKDWFSHLDDFKQIDVSVYHSLKFFKENELIQFDSVIEQYFTTSQVDGTEVALCENGF